MKKVLLFFLLIGSTVLFAQQKQFNKTVLQSMFVDLKGNEVSFEDIIGKHKGKKVVVEIWASWCSDCIKAMPTVKKMIKKQQDKVDFVFISMDKSFKAFQDGVEKHQLEKGDHYFSKTPWKESEFAKNIALDWIPRYLVLDEKGTILLFKAVTPDDKKLIQLLK